MDMDRDRNKWDMVDPMGKVKDKDQYMEGVDTAKKDNLDNNVFLLHDLLFSPKK